MINKKEYIETDNMEKEFNLLNERYNKMASNKNEKIVHEMLLNDETVIEDKSKLCLLKEINSILSSRKKIIEEQQTTITPYEECEKDMKELFEMIDDVNKKQKKLADKLHKIDDITIEEFKYLSINTDQLNIVSAGIKNAITQKNNKIKLITDQINEYKKLITESFTEQDLKYVKELSVVSVCSNCNINKINVCVVPCGHALCDKCAEKTIDQCVICKKNVTNTINLIMKEKNVILDHENIIEPANAGGNQKFAIFDFSGEINARTQPNFDL